MSASGLVRVRVAWAVFGLVVCDGVVVDAAPIAAWCVGRDARAVWCYWRDRGAALEWFPDDERAAPDDGDGP